MMLIFFSSVSSSYSFSSYSIQFNYYNYTIYNFKLIFSPLFRFVVLKFFNVALHSFISSIKMHVMCPWDTTPLHRGIRKILHPSFLGSDYRSKSYRFISKLVWLVFFNTCSFFFFNTSSFLDVLSIVVYNLLFCD